MNENPKALIKYYINFLKCDYFWGPIQDSDTLCSGWDVAWRGPVTRLQGDSDEAFLNSLNTEN